MPPQPLSKIKSDASVILGPEALSGYPHLASFVMQVIAIWAHIEGNLASMLTNCLRSDIATGAAMYQALISADAKRAALNAVAQSYLSESDFRIFQAVMKVVKPSRDRRNDFAHHIWAFSPEVPDALLLMHPSVVLNHNVSWRQFIEDYKTPIAVEEGKVRYVRPMPAKTSLDPTKIQVFRDADFQRDLVAAEAADDYVMLLWELTRRGDGYAPARLALLAEPQIAAILQKPTPSPPPESPSQ
jgi:hypothetical protein